MKWQNILNLSALILSIVNGLFLLISYLKDKPKLKVEPVHPKIYQWWFKLPNGKTEDGQITRKYGFLTYVSINNKGLRRTTLDEWNLIIKDKTFKKRKLKAVSIPEP